MPNTIINQEQQVINYISELNLPYSSALKNHMVNILSGIIVTEGDKNISKIYNKVTCNRDRSTGSRFLSEYKWNNEYVAEERIFHAVKKISSSVRPTSVGFLIIDDTLSKKHQSTRHIEGLDFHCSHADGNKAMWSHCLVTSHYAIEDFSIPLNFKQYHRKDASGIKANKLFRNKQQLAFELIDEFKPATNTNYLLIDAWYTSAKVILHGLKNGYHTVGRIKSNRTIYPAGIKVSAKDFSKHIRKNEVSLVTASSDDYYVYRYEGKLNDIENAVVLISWNKKDLSGAPSFIISTDVSLDNETIIAYYEKRWGIEVSYRTHKTLLGLDEFQVESQTSIHRYWEMVFLTYTFLELFRVENGKVVNLKTLGDTAEYFRNKYLVQLINFAYNCAQNGVTLATTISNLGLAA